MRCLQQISTPNCFQDNTKNFRFLHSTQLYTIKKKKKEFCVDWFSLTDYDMIWSKREDIKERIRREKWQKMTSWQQVRHLVWCRDSKEIKSKEWVIFSSPLSFQLSFKNFLVPFSLTILDIFSRESKSCLLDFFYMYDDTTMTRVE